MPPEIEADEYCSFLAAEYLGSFIAAGGSAVKVTIVPDVATARVLSQTAIQKATEQG